MYSEWFTITKAVHYLNIYNDEIVTFHVLQHLTKLITETTTIANANDLYNYLPLILSIYLQKIDRNNLRNIGKGSDKRVLAGLALVLGAFAGLLR